MLMITGRSLVTAAIVSSAVVAVSGCGGGSAADDRAEAAEESDASDSVPISVQAPATTTPTTSPASTTTSTSTTSTTTTTEPLRPITLLFTGDVLMHSPLWSQARRNAEASGLADAVRDDPRLDTDGVPETPPLDFAPMFDHIAPLVASVDLAICHLETPIAPPGEAYSTHPRYGVPAEVVDGLAAAGFDHCSTASNHTFDRGIPALETTIDRFAQVGITQEGMAATPDEAGPSLLEVDGTIVGHLSYSYGWDVGSRPADEPWRAALIDPERIIADADAARQAGAELVIASLHWGNSGSPVASASQQEIAAILAESGLVDLVVGHHAHVVQPVEQVGGMWVAYGLGNLISNLPVPDSYWGPETQDGAILTVEIDRTGTVPTISAVAVHPIWVDKTGKWVVRDVLRSIADGEATSAIEASLRRTSRVLGEWIDVPVE